MRTEKEVKQEIDDLEKRVLVLYKELRNIKDSKIMNDIGRCFNKDLGPSKKNRSVHYYKVLDIYQKRTGDYFAKFCYVNTSDSNLSIDFYEESYPLQFCTIDIKKEEFTKVLSETQQKIINKINKEILLTEK